VSPRPTAELLAELERLGVRLDLDSFRALLAALGRPERAAPVALVAGTNGKGSTAAMLESIVRAAGYRTVLYTSPHLERVEERIRIDGEPVGSDHLAAELARVVAAAARTGLETPTYFEALTAAAFLVCAARPPDLALFEVGLGGRLDATNAADPVLSVITPIALDHTETLGPTLTAIAGEKAGILRPGVPLVLAAQTPEPERALLAAAHARGAPVVRAEHAAAVRARRVLGLAGQWLRFEGEAGPVEAGLPLAGSHQADNAATAVAAAARLARGGFPAIDAAAIRRGLESVRWPGRLETVTLAGGRTLLVDSAHNAHGCAALAGFLAALGRPYTLLFGALADKQVDAMLPLLADGAGRVVLARPESPRAREPGSLRPLVPRGRPTLVESDPARALAAAAVAAATGEIVVAGGSIFLAGAVRRAAREHWGAAI
jgi:dihydrofolate synthase/folylpolyglutamate synthase